MNPNNSFSGAGEKTRSLIRKFQFENSKLGIRAIVVGNLILLVVFLMADLKNLLVNNNESANYNQR